MEPLGHQSTSALGGVGSPTGSVGGGIIDALKDFDVEGIRANVRDLMAKVVQTERER